MDHLLRRLELQVQAEPADPGLRARLRAQLARLADLEDRRAWGDADPAAQDLVLGVLARLLGPAFTHEGTAPYTAGGASHRIAAFRHGASGVLLHLLPGGPATLGDPDDPCSPPREVRLAPFLLGRYPLRQEEWDRIGGDDERSWEGPDLPMEGVSWTDATAWLTRAGGGLRLPSEAEWEYACRAGTTTGYFWGDEPDLAYCWFGESAHEWATHPVSAHADRPNAFGLVDTSGNVAEWCADAFVAPAQLVAAPRDGTPVAGGSRVRSRVVRGGDAFNSARCSRSAHRNEAAATDRGAGIGFRVARSWPLS